MEKKEKKKGRASSGSIEEKRTRLEGEGRDEVQVAHDILQSLGRKKRGKSFPFFGTTQKRNGRQS